MDQAGKSPDAVELTVEQAWFLAETVGAGTFPWVLAITIPLRHESQRAGFNAQRTQELTRAGIVGPDGAVNPTVASWIRTVCRPQRWLELRYVAVEDQPAQAPDLMRGLLACGGTETVVALRNAHLITLTAIDAHEPSALVPAVVAGLRWRKPAHFPEFTMPAKIGAKADEQLRHGSSLTEILGYLGVPTAAHTLVESAFTGPRSYVEVVAGQRDDVSECTSEVGVSVIDTAVGRILVSPRRAHDGAWLSTFAPGTDFAIAVAVDQLTDSLPDGQWFPNVRLTRNFA